MKCSEIFRIGNGWPGGERSVCRKSNIRHVDDLSYRDGKRFDVVADGNMTF